MEEAGGVYNRFLKKERRRVIIFTDLREERNRK